MALTVRILIFHDYCVYCLRSVLLVQERWDRTTCAYCKRVTYRTPYMLGDTSVYDIR